ncbi:hypothetical protein OIDMADRAFT_60960 [Oidiodendron maius Zn]|uniref:Alpha/beta hydrolase fold-3 domain-containing protein n=1 Tax=Oidiodendron maius (strain Zn) TaxID=913774 RepID=A0A0C3GV19_OIDMZ|nr:hypothetical protein OIDMADRAFT_60960 [Oidiodendron maius Zn]
MVVNFHGGGWILGGVESTFFDLRPLVTEFKAVVVDVSYRLSPEHPFPTPVNDCWDALQWAAKNAAIWNADPEVGFIVAGNSAGANLAAVVTVLARDNQLSPPLTGCCLTALPAMLDEIYRTTTLTRFLHRSTSPPSTGSFNTYTTPSLQTFDNPQSTEFLSYLIEELQHAISEPLETVASVLQIYPDTLDWVPKKAFKKSDT